MRKVCTMKHKIMEYDANLAAFERDFDLRAERLERKKKELLKNAATLSDFANGHLFYGFHHFCLHGCLNNYFNIRVLNQHISYNWSCKIT